MRIAVFLMVLSAATGAAAMGDDCPAGTTLVDRPSLFGAERTCALPDGRREGPYRLESRGLVTDEGRCAGGKQQGEWIHRTNDGTVTREEWAAGVRDGKARVERNGRPVSEGAYRAGKQEGRWTEWHPNGQKRSEELWSGGQKEGTATLWFEDGKLEQQEQWRHGKRHGPSLLFGKGGQKLIESSYVDGSLDGRYRTWWAESGAPEVEATYRAGALVGHFVEHHDGGRALAEGDYVDGEKDGRWEGWDEEGRVHLVGVYRAGKLVSGAKVRSSQEVLAEARGKVGMYGMLGLLGEGGPCAAPIVFGDGFGGGGLGLETTGTIGTIGTSRGSLRRGEGHGRLGTAPAKKKSTPPSE
jgi:antitoxin component YwqK of YwqJK toxin-antitoxin module